MAVYNGSKFIKEQIISVICQLKEGDELIISDDGSTDETLSILHSFEDTRIKVHKNNGKKGPVGNFENAINHASGDVIFLCDQDDIWFPEKIERHLQQHVNYDLVVSDAIVTDENGNVIFKSFFNARKSRKGLLYNLFRNSYIGCCMSFKKCVLKQALPFPHHIHMHDWWIGLVAEIKGSIFFLNQPMMYYIRHSNNASDTLVRTLPITKQLSNRFLLIINLVKLVLLNGKG
jgi:glycosyltransferase involved in cell wall biosynthesis